MPKLILQDNLKIKQPVVIPFKEGLSAADMLESKFKSIDLNKATLHINDEQVFANDYQALLSPLKNGDSVTLTSEVKGGFLGDVVDFALDITGVGFVLGLLQDALAPDLPQGQETTSPNNNLTSQTNLIRAYSQKALVCGSPRIYPDLIGEPIEYYTNNIKYSESYFYTSFGTLNNGTVKAGETDIIRFAGATANLYYPTAGITTIPNYRVGQQVDEIDGQTLKGTNEGEDGATITCTEGPSETTYTGTTFIIYLAQDTDSDNLKAQYDASNVNVEVQYLAFITQEPQGAPQPVRPTGTGNITEFTLTGSEYKVVVSNFNGDKSETVYGDPYEFTIKLDNTLGPFVNPTQCEKMFFNITFTRGLKATVPITVTVYELDAQGGTRTGTEETFNVSYTGDTIDAQYRTFEINIANGRTWYEWTIQRTNEATENTDKPDIPKLEKAFCIKEVGDYDFNNATMLKTIMNSTQTPTSSGVDNKINIVDGQVEMPSYDESTGTVLVNAPSRNLADAVMFVWRDFHGLDLDLLDLDELYTIVDALPEGFKTFDYTFDDSSVSVGEKLDIILNVGRIQKYWDGQKIRFWRDEKVDFNSALLSRTDIASASERSYSVSRSSFVAGEYDSVQVEYVNREINKKAYIYRSIDSGGNIVNVSGSNPKTVALSGCQDIDNATNRAELEIRRMLYQRWTLSDTFLDSQRFLGKGDVVLYNEVYEGGAAWGGEIQSINGGQALVRENLTLDSGTSYYVYYTNMLGDVIGPQLVTAFSSNSFTCADLSEAYARGDDNAQIGSRYYITEVNNSINRQWRVVNRESSGYNVQVSLINYDERIYAYDTIQQIPNIES